MKILMLNYEYPPVGGGGGLISKYIAEGLADMGHEIVFITVSDNTKDYVTHEGNLKLIRLYTGRKKQFKATVIDMLKWNKCVWKYIKENINPCDFDFCFAHFVMPCGALALRLKKKHGLDYVVMSHGHDIPWVKPISLWVYYIFSFTWIKNVLKNSNRIFVQSDEMVKNANRFLPGKYFDRIIKIPNGADNKIFYSQKTRRNNIIKIIFAGRLVYQKNPFMLLKALNILKRKYNVDFEAFIYGDGHLKKRINKYIKKKGLGNCVVLKGRVVPENMPAVYQFGDVFVNTSISEGMSLALIEAVFSGLYVIATPASGNNEIISLSGRGKIIPFNDYNLLAEELYKYDKIKNKDFTLPDEFINNYNWRNIVEKYAKELTSMIK
ncbi:MAG: glycosyltransferase [Marinilabiliales bacterium]